MKTIIAVILLAVASSAECKSPKDYRVLVTVHFTDESEVSELLFVSAMKERINLLPHACVAQPTTGEPTYFVDLQGVSVTLGRFFAVSVAWGPSLFASHHVVTFSNDHDQINIMARLAVDNIAEFLSSTAVGATR